MKLQELNEAVQNFTPSVEEYKKSKEFKDILEYFDYVSTKRQENNGNLYFVTKSDIMKRSKEYKIAYSGEVSTKNADASIWAKVNGLGPKGINLESERPFIYRERSADVIQHFLQWAAKKQKSLTDVSNRNLTSLTPLLLPETIKGETFDCSHNLLKDLIGGPTEFVKYYHAQDNELISPLKGCPNKVDDFNLNKNKLTSFEGFPLEMTSLAVKNNPIKQISGISKHIKKLEYLGIDFIDNVGYLELFKIQGFKDLRLHNASDENISNALRKILNKHLSSQERDMLECQEELISSDFKRFAKL